MLRIYKLCWPYLKSEKKRFFFYTFLYLLLSAVGLLTTYVTGEFVDALETATDTSFIFRYALVFTAIAMGHILVRYLINCSHSILESNCCHNMEEAAIHSVQKTSLGYAQNKDTTQLTYKINNYACMSVIFCYTTPGKMISNGLKCLAPLVFLFVIRPSLGFVLLGVIVADALAYKLLKRPSYKAEKESTDSRSEYFSLLMTQLANVKFIQLQSIANNLILKFRASRDWLRGKALKAMFVSSHYDVVKILLNAISTIAAIFIGGAAVIKGEITLGQFTVILSYLSVAIGSLEYFFTLGQNVQQTKVYCDGLEEIFSQKPQTNGEKVVENIEKVECRGLDFG